MKKLLWLFLVGIILLPVKGWAVDTKISAMTTKGTPVAADLIPILDSANSNANAKATIGSLPFATPLSPAPADGTYSGAAITCQNGEAGAMALGDVVFIKNGATNTVPTVGFAKADSTSSDKYPAMGMVMATIASGNTGPVLLSGFVQNTAWSALTVGGVEGSLWVSVTGTTGNTWTQTKPVASGNVQMYLGSAVNDAYSAGHTGQSKTIFFNPSPVWNVAP